jgi:protein-L-isoaspartate(D-aspartate) O-methyltransferase
MTEQLNVGSTHRVLEIGTGSGYQAAVLSRLAREVVTIERYRTLADQGTRTAQGAWLRQRRVVAGDGFAGMPERAPFDRIIVTAAAETIPEALMAQLADDGIMILPLGSHEGSQHIIKLTKSQTGTQRENLIPVRFVPMLPGQAQEL